MDDLFLEESKWGDFDFQCDQTGESHFGLVLLTAHMHPIHFLNATSLEGHLLTPSFCLSHCIPLSLHARLSLSLPAASLPRSLCQSHSLALSACLSHCVP